MVGGKGELALTPAECQCYGDACALATARAPNRAEKLLCSPLAQPVPQTCTNFLQTLNRKANNGI